MHKAAILKLRNEIARKGGARREDDSGGGDLARRSRAHAAETARLRDENDPTRMGLSGQGDKLKRRENSSARGHNGELERAHAAEGESFAGR